MSGSSPKQLEANWRNAQRSTGPQTPCDDVAAIPVLSEAEGSDRGSQTSALKPFSDWDDIPVERSAVAPARRFRTFRLSQAILRSVPSQNAIERPLNRATDSLQEHRGLSHLQPSETLPIDEK
jgi:hypothetical protein